MYMFSSLSVKTPGQIPSNSAAEVCKILLAVGSIDISIIMHTSVQLVYMLKIVDTVLAKWKNFQQEFQNHQFAKIQTRAIHSIKGIPVVIIITCNMK